MPIPGSRKTKGPLCVSPEWLLLGEITSSSALIRSVANIFVSCSQDRGTCTIQLRTQDRTNGVVTGIQRYCFYLFLVRTEVCKYRCCVWGCITTCEKSQGKADASVTWHFTIIYWLYNQWTIIISAIKVKLLCSDIPFLLKLTHHWWWLLTHMPVHTHAVPHNRVWACVHLEGAQIRSHDGASRHADFPRWPGRPPRCFQKNWLVSHSTHTRTHTCSRERT